MDKQKCRSIMDKIKAHLKSLDLGDVVIEMGSASFSRTDATIKIKVSEKSETGEVLRRELSDFNTYCEQFGLKPSDFGRTFIDGRKTFKICGLKPRSWKHPILCSWEGKTYKFPAELVRSLLGYTGASPSLHWSQSDHQEIG